jgi:poly(3-hydroxyalkanoate) synthetase
MAGLSHQGFLWVPLLNLLNFAHKGRESDMYMPLRWNVQRKTVRGCSLNINKYDIWKLVTEPSAAKLCQNYNMQNDVCKWIMFNKRLNTTVLLP